MDRWCKIEIVGEVEALYNISGNISRVDSGRRTKAGHVESSIVATQRTMVVLVLNSATCNTTMLLVPANVWKQKER